MRPLRLELHNFMSYKDARLDLSETSVAAIVGPNGAGKSTLLQAITYALWGQVRTSSHNDVVRNGTAGCTVRFTFRLNDSLYTVTRRRDLSGRGSSSLELVGDGNPLTAPTIRETQTAIDRVLGFTYESLMASSAIQQGDASRFSAATPGERKELLISMLGLDIFQELEAKARKHAKWMNANLITIRATLDYTVDELGKLERAEENFEAAKIELQDTEETLAELELETDGINQALDEIRELERDGVEAQRMADNIRAAIKSQAHELLDVQNEIARDRKIIERGQEIRMALSRFTLLKTRLSEIEEEREKQEMANAIQAKIDKEAALIGQQVDRLPGVLADLDGLLEKQEGLLARKAETEEIITLLKISAGDESKNLEAMEKDLFDMRQRGVVIAQKIAELKSQKRLLEESDECPTCGQVIPDKSALLDSVTDKLEKSQSRHKVTLRETGDLAEMVANLRDWINHQTDTINKHMVGLAAIDSGLESLKESIETTTETSQQLAVAADRLKFNDFAYRLRDELNALGEIKFDTEEYAAVREEMAQLSNAPIEHAMLQDAEEKIKHREERASRHKRLMKEHSSELRTTIKGMAAIDSEIQIIGNKGELHERLARLCPEISYQKERYKRALENTAQADLAVKRKSALKEECEELISKLDKYERKLDIAETLVRATSKTGAPALLIEAVLPQLEKDANRFLDLMAPGMSLSLESQRLTLKGSASETLDIRIINKGIDVPIETLSGGERFRADLALRLAIGSMLSRRSGSQVNFLIIDEGFGSQDADGQESIVDVVRSLITVFDLIVVISHIQHIAHSLANDGALIKISKGEFSEIEVE